MDSGCLLYGCQLCGCLVNASTLRAGVCWAADRAGILRPATRLVCADGVVCGRRRETEATASEPSG